MKKCGVDRLSEQLTQAQDLGVHLHLCEMSSDILGIDCDELIEGAELAGLAIVVAAGSQNCTVDTF